MDNFITLSLTYAIIGIVMYFLADKIYADNGNEIIKNLKEEHIIIRLPKVYKWIGLIGAMIVSIGSVLANTFLNPISSPDFWVVTVLGLFTLIGLYLFWEQQIWRIDVYRHGDHFIFVTGFRIKHKIYYSDIIYYKLGNNYIHIKTKRKFFLIDNKAVCIEFLMAALSTNRVKEIKIKR
jgi:hypothetical protein